MQRLIEMVIVNINQTNSIVLTVLQNLNVLKVILRKNRLIDIFGNLLKKKLNTSDILMFIKKFIRKEKKQLNESLRMVKKIIV